MNFAGENDVQRRISCLNLGLQFERNLAEGRRGDDRPRRLFLLVTRLKDEIN